jgi:hypothetical protein
MTTEIAGIFGVSVAFNLILCFLCILQRKQLDELHEETARRVDYLSSVSNLLYKQWLLKKKEKKKSNPYDFTEPVEDEE